ncbi:MAG: flagellar protein export ATPase FliI [Gammaproteobacteria bacterium]|nr:flagellar protein export ATPase FliI [Gammaproteobacteria bacterium]
MLRQSLAQRLRQYQPQFEPKLIPIVEGRLTRVVGLTLEAVGCNVSLGGRCSVTDGHGREIEAEVVGFDGPRIYLMPLTGVEGLQPGAKVVPLDGGEQLAVGTDLLGRVLNGLGQPIDGRGEVPMEIIRTSTAPKTINPLQRQPIRKSLDVGITTINSLLTVGRGQRLGLFAGSGVGKSVLLGMMTQFTTADVIVVGLIGERGREVKEFIDEILGEQGLSRAVVVASPADDAPLLRLRAAILTTRIAEGFRDQGKDVLLLMDSLTRYAMAQREIALAIGEPPATKGYPPSVFAKIPQLVERAGNAAKGQGSITAFYTVLTEGDDQQDPIADSARAILDGHIVLSRTLAESGHYPAIDIEASISRVMPAIVTPDHFAKMQLFRRIYSRYQQNRDLISVGAYVAGSDKDTDFAIERMPHLRQFMQQGLKERVGYEEAVQKLNGVVIPPARTGEAVPNNVTPLQSRTLSHQSGAQSGKAAAACAES